MKFRELILKARKIVRFNRTFDKIDAIYSKCQFFYKYEKIFERQIRDSKAERILTYQRLLHNRKLQN